MTAVTINLNHGRPGQPHSWPMRQQAEATLRALRQRGLNVDRVIAIHRAVYLAWRPYVIARPDERGEFFLLMTHDGSWVRGRLYDEPPTGGGAAWHPMEGEPIPPTFSHVTRTVPYHARAERYRTKSNGSCGRWVVGDDSVALCTCGWKSYVDTRPEAQSAARVHRAQADAR